MSALGPGEIAARRRPWVIAFIASIRFLCGFCLTWPLSSLIGSSGIGLFTQGDRALFEGGGYLLLELLRIQGSALSAVLHGLLPIFGVGLVLTAACNAALLVALNTSGRLSRSDWFARALARVPAIVLLAGATAIAQLVVVVAAVFGSSAVPERLANPVATTLGQAAVWCLAATLAAAVGGFSDVVRAALVRYDTGLRQALTRGLRSLQHRPFRSLFGWFPFALLLLAVALLGSKLSDTLDVSRSGAWRVVAVLLVHQGVVLAAVAARAAWFARALRLIATEESGTRLALPSS